MMHTELSAIGFPAIRPPLSEITGLEALRLLWRNASLDEIDTREITVRRTFADFEEYWTTSTLAATVRQTINAMHPSDVGLLKERMRGRLSADAEGHVTSVARANAIRGVRSR
ncbi:MAG: glycosyltransferase family 1 protein [Mesorhizobium sp.]|nr:MAG: glycosyltransferase family 1 protein [Mesorhizobium sp.]